MLKSLIKCQRLQKSIWDRLLIQRSGSSKLHANLSLDSSKSFLARVKHLNEKFVEVDWKDSKKCQYPHIFLRDNCQCNNCLDPVSKNRLLSTVYEVDLQIQPKSLHIDGEKDELIITWPDNHVSKYTGEWLCERHFPETKADIHPNCLNGLKKELWSDNMAKHLPIIEFDQLMTSDRAVINHVENLVTLGISIIRNAPKQAGVLENDIPSRTALGYVKQTHYGKIFQVKAKHNASSAAYTSGSLILHTDLPYFMFQPCIQHLHCIEQSRADGEGVSHLADGIKAAEILRRRHPEYFDVLANVLFRFSDEGCDEYGDFRLAYERPIFHVNKSGEVETVHYTNAVRGSFINALPEDVFKAYEAYYAYTKIIYEDNVLVNYKMYPGDILVFDNKRILHGRTPFDAAKTSRWLEGVYLDWDAVLARYRVLKNPLKKSLTI